MTRFCAVVSILIAVASGAASKEVTVRSGEHDGYTRLVFNVPPDTGWVLAQQKNGATLTVEVDDVTFQTRSVFGRLTTNRLSSLSQSQPGAALNMEFGCDCGASAFLFRNSMIVVDIAPGISLPPLTTYIPPPVSTREPDRESHPKRLGLKVDLKLPPLNMNEQEFRDQLSARLLQGADRSLLDLNLAPVAPRNSSSVSRTAVPPGLSSNIHLSSVLDDLNGLLGAELLQIGDRPTCFSTTELGFDHWSEARPFHSQLADLRVGLYQEFDHLDDERAVSLAELYAFYGFGAEAIRVLGLMETQTPELTRVSAIAYIMDDRQMSGPNPFRKLQRCDSDAALWAVLSESELAPEADVEAIEQAFARLPEHLRRTLGPRVSSILVDAQELEAARRVLRSVNRIELTEHSSVTRVKAKVAEAAGDDERAETLLSEVASSPGALTEAPLALARLVDKRWVDRGAVTSQELGLAASYAMEFRRSEIGPMMARTHAVALGLNHEFDSALDLIKTLPDGEEVPVTLNRHLQLLAERSDDVTFLRQTLAMPSELTDLLSTDTAIVLSRRLASLGFAAQTFALANRQQDSTRRSERARLRARAALMDGRPHQAMLELESDASRNAFALRVQAMSAVEDYAAAGEMSRELGETMTANRYLWLAGLPPAVGSEPAGKFADINAAATALSEPPIRLPARPLADAANLLDDSAKARQQIAELLDSVKNE
ncbi:hypothetical protein [uncultured Ruegeria sp.]|uniref:hypothetical protein n=1 Tax=uncultured Ruegeria sp. TaxID=259304 RepID=UPI002634E73D|nr:hypothetical protein [uncultured Ruegeria sp.]